MDETFKESEIQLRVFVDWQTGFVSAFKTKPCHSGPLCIPGYWTAFIMDLWSQVSAEKRVCENSPEPQRIVDDQVDDFEHGRQTN